jgi:hypothetical protein
VDERVGEGALEEGVVVHAVGVGDDAQRGEDEGDDRVLGERAAAREPAGDAGGEEPRLELGPDVVRSI